MKCYNCKASIPDGETTCPRCGYSQVIGRDLVDLAASGDQDAIADLYNRTYNAVYNTLKFILKDEDSVLDVLQDSYIKAFSSLEQLQDASKFEAWIKRIAHNRAIDELRKAKPLNFSEMVSDDSDEVLEFEDDRPDNMPEVVIDQKETARLLGEILDSLPDEQRVCVTMFYYDQLSVKEISSELGVSEATVKSRLNYGRRKIESQVRELEKKGTKLYGIAPIPFLLMLLRQELELSESSASAILENVLNSSAAGISEGLSGAAAELSGSTAKTAAVNTVSAAAKTAAAAAGAAKVSLGAKIVAAVLAVAVIGGGAAAISQGMHRSPEPPEEPAIEEPVPQEPAESELEANKAPENVQPESEAIQDENQEEGEISRDDMMKAFEDIRAGYEGCMSGNADSDSPFLKYSAIEWCIKNNDPPKYALYDINGDGSEEMILGYQDEGFYTPFEIYAFDGKDAVPLTPGFVRDFTYINISNDQTIRTHIGNGGDPQEEVYELSAKGPELIHIRSENIFESDRPGDVQNIVYNSILTSISNAEVTDTSSEELSDDSDDEMNRHIKEQFGIPEDYDCDIFIDWENMSYWEAAGRMVVHCTITHNGKEVASADINPVTGDLEKEIIAFSEDQ